MTSITKFIEQNIESSEILINPLDNYENFIIKYNLEKNYDSIIGYEYPTIINYSIEKNIKPKILLKLIDKLSYFKMYNGKEINEECSVCLEPLKEKAVKLSCGHMFHENCLNKWIKQKENCPYCKSDLLNDPTYFSKENRLYIASDICYTYSSDVLEKYIDKFPDVVETSGSVLNYTIHSSRYYSCKQLLIDQNNKVNLIFPAILNGQHGLKNIDLLCTKYKYNFWDSFQAMLRPNNNNYYSFLTITDFVNLFYYNTKNRLLEFFKKYSLPQDQYFSKEIIYKLVEIIDSILDNSHNNSNKSINSINTIFSEIVKNNKDYKASLLRALFENNNLTIIKSLDESYFIDNIEILYDILRTIVNEFTKNNSKSTLKVSLIRILVKHIDNYLQNSEDRSSKDYITVKNCFRNLIKEPSFLCCLAATKNTVNIFKKIDKYDLNYNYSDYDCFYPAIDAARYGSFDTFKYLLKKTETYNLLSETICSNSINIVGASCLNTDFRIMKYIFNNLYKTLNLDNYLTIDKTGKLVDLICKSTNNEKYIYKKIKLMHDTSNKPINIHYVLEKCSKMFVNKLLDNLSNVIISLNTFNTLSSYSYKCLKLHDKSTYFINKIVKHTLNNNYIKDKNFELLKILSYLCFYALKNNTKFDNKYIKYLIEIIDFKSNDTTLLSVIYKHISNFDSRNYILKYEIDKIQTLITLIINNGFNINSKESVKRIQSMIRLLLHSDEGEHTSLLLATFMKIGLNIFNENFLSEWTENEYNKIVIKFYTGFYKKIRNIKRLVKKRYKKFKDSHKNAINFINNEIEYFPVSDNKELYKNLGSKFKSNINSLFVDKAERQHPKHCNPKNLFSIMDKDNIITNKVDGVIKRGIDNIKFYPPLPELVDGDIIEAEYIEKDNMYFVIDTYDNSVPITEFYLYLLNNHNYLKGTTLQELDKVKIFDKKSYGEELERNMTLLNVYKDSLENKNKEIDNINEKYCGWWPKKMWVANKNRELIKDLIEIKDKNFSIYPTDGWIITNIENRESIKVKPDKQITVDLLFKNGNWSTDSRNISYIKAINNYNSSYNSYNSYESNSVYRCYFCEETKCWEPREKRLDKHRPNKNCIEQELYNYHINKWSLENILDILSKTNVYYQVNNYNISKSKKEITSNTISINDFIDKHINNIKCINTKSILDIGCGFGTKLNNKHIKTIKKYIGVDVDFNVINKLNSKFNKNHKCEYKLLDISQKWDLSSQRKVYNSSIYDYYNKYNCNNNILDTTFNVFLSINSIHYAAKNTNTWKNFTEEINKRSTLGSIFIISYLDRNKLDKFLTDDEPLITNGSSFVRKVKDINNNINNDIDNSVTNYWIKIYYDWTHTKPCLEAVINKENILKYLNENKEQDKKWKILDEESSNINSDINHDINNNNKWNNYMNCFSRLCLEYC